MQDARREHHNRRRRIIIEHKSLPDISVEAGELDVSARADSFFFFMCESFTVFTQAPGYRPNQPASWIMHDCNLQSDRCNVSQALM